MNRSKSLSFLTLMLLISFAAVNAILFTPALPNVASFLNITKSQSEFTVSLFLVGYAFGQLIYGPMANRYGRKPALYVGILVQIFSSFLCVIAGKIQSYECLVIARIFLALGSGVGLNMTFTLVNECYESKIASQKTAYLLFAFAIISGLSVALGGTLNQYLGWESCFYASAFYGIVLLILVRGLPETLIEKDYNALKLGHLIHSYRLQFFDKRILAGGCLMGAAGCFLYIFSAIAPFVCMQFFGMNSEDYGLANFLPYIGLALGSLMAAYFAKKWPLTRIIIAGISISALGVVFYWLSFFLHLSAMMSVFFPAVVSYFGLCFIIGNASTLALNQSKDKAHASAVINFINVGFSMSVVLFIGFFSIKLWLMPIIFSLLIISMLTSYFVLKFHTKYD